jgi:hypothetical protein
MTSFSDSNSHVLCCHLFFLCPFLSFIFLIHDLVLLTRPVLDLNFFYGVSNYAGTF